MIVLPRPPDLYDRTWANQYSREIELSIGQLQALIQQLQRFQLPSYTTAERDSLTLVKVGTLIFDTDLDAPCVYTSASGWREIQLV